MIYQLGGREPLISSWSEVSQKDRILFPKNLEDIPAGIGRSEHREFQGDYKENQRHVPLCTSFLIPSLPHLQDTFSKFSAP